MVTDDSVPARSNYSLKHIKHRLIARFQVLNINKIILIPLNQHTQATHASLYEQQKTGMNYLTAAHSSPPVPSQKLFNTQNLLQIWKRITD